jgi:hypothetical protein
MKLPTFYERFQNSHLIICSKVGQKRKQQKTNNKKITNKNPGHLYTKYKVEANSIGQTPKPPANLSKTTTKLQMQNKSTTPMLSTHVYSENYRMRAITTPAL